MADVAQNWRFDPKSGAAVNDESKTVWVDDAVGWVRADGWGYKDGRVFRVESLPDAQKSAAEKAIEAAKTIFGADHQGIGSRTPGQLVFQTPEKPSIGPKPGMPSLSAEVRGTTPNVSSPGGAAPAQPTFADFNKALGLA